MCKWVRITGQGVGHYSWPVTAMIVMYLKPFLHRSYAVKSPIIPAPIIDIGVL